MAECLTESIVTQADTWEELRANVLDAVEGYFFDGPKPRSIRLHLFGTKFFRLDEASKRS